MFGAQTNAPNVFGTQSTPGFGTFGAQQQQQPVSLLQLPLIFSKNRTFEAAI
jgi:hypothetical protein